MTHTLRLHALAAAAALGLAAAALPAHAQTSPATPGTSATGSSATASDLRVAQATGGSGMTRSDYGRDAYSLIPGTRRGYVGINIGKLEYDLGCGNGAYGCDDPDASAYLYTGGYVNDWLGAEIGFLQSGRAERAGGRTRTQGLNLSAVFRMPLGAFNVFAKAGAMYSQNRVNTGPLSDVPSGKRRGWGATYGAGVGFDFTPNAGLVLEWARYQLPFPGLGREDADLTSVGFVYRF